MRALAAILLAMMVLAGPAAAAERRFDRDCMDDYARDLCDPAMRARIRDAVDVAPAESLAASGVEGVRVFMIDGYSRDQPLVTILRAADGRTTLEVRAPGDTPTVRGKAATDWQWEVAKTLTRVVTASPEKPLPDPVPAGQSQPLSMCLHAWVAVVEVLEAGGVTRRIRNACGDNPVFDGAFSLGGLAIGGLDRCEDLNANHYRNDWSRLFDCVRLRGESLYAAAQVINRVREGMFDDSDRAAAETLEMAFATDAMVTWDGAPAASGRTAAAALWRAKSVADKGSTLVLHVSIAEGAGETVRVTGELMQYSVEEGGRLKGAQTAPFTQIWAPGRDYRWRITRWEVGPFRPFETQ
jgi:hypothetical protein